MKTVLSLVMVVIAAILMNSCESEKSKRAKVAKMEQISINGSNYGLEVWHSSSATFYPDGSVDGSKLAYSGYVTLHPEGSDGKEGCWFRHEDGPIYVYRDDYRTPPDSFEDGEKKGFIFNLNLKKIILAFESEGTGIRVYPMEELLVPGGKMHGVIVTSHHVFPSRGFIHYKVYTLDGVLRYDNKKEWPAVVIEGGYIYDASRNGHKPSDKLYKILPDGSKERVPGT